MYMISISTLSHLTPEQLIPAFNQAFADYIVPVNLTPLFFRQKVIQENLRLEFSTGTFDNGRLVGLMLHGIGEMNGEPVAYNGGTGVIPEYRGRHLVERMYSFLKPRLETAGIRRLLLEVIDTNERAIRAYRRVGFRELRALDCFKGELKGPALKPGPDYNVTVRPGLPWEELPSFWNYRPTWQHSLDAARRGQGFMQYVAVEEKGRLRAYGIMIPGSGRIVQYGVHPGYRGMGLGRLVFHHFAQLGNPCLTVLNISREEEQSQRFLRRIGFVRYLGQYEMEWRT